MFGASSWAVGRDPQSRASSTSIQTGHPNPTQAKPDVPAGYPKGNSDSCSISLPGWKVRRTTGREEQHGASLQDQSHWVRAGRALQQGINAALQRAQSLGCCGCSERVPARSGAGRALGAGRGCHSRRLPPVSACNPALLAAASAGKAASLLLCSYHRCVAQGWI